MLKVVKKDNGYWLSIDGTQKAFIHLGATHGEIVESALAEAAQDGVEPDECSVCKGRRVVGEGENIRICLACRV